MYFYQKRRLVGVKKVMQIILSGRVTKLSDKLISDKLDVQLIVRRQSGSEDAICVLCNKNLNIHVGDYLDMSGYVKFLSELKSLCIVAQNVTVLDSVPAEDKNIVLGDGNIAKPFIITNSTTKKIGRLHLVDKWNNEINCSVWGQNIELCKTFKLQDTIEIVGRLHSHMDGNKYVSEISILKLRRKELNQMNTVTKTVELNLNEISKAQSFERQASKTDCDITLISEPYKVNGKSLLGIFSLDLSKNAICEVSGNETDVDAFIEGIKDFMV